MSTVLVEAKIGAGAARVEKFLSTLDESAAKAKASEPRTLAYFAAQSGEDSHELLVFQKRMEKSIPRRLRLSKKRKLPSSSLVNKLVGKKKNEKNEKNGKEEDLMPPVHFRDVQGFGFWNRPGMHANADAVFCWSVSRFQETWMRDRWLEITKPFAQWCFDNEPDTIMYSGGIALSDNSHYNIRKGDLIFVNLYTCAEAKQAHDRSQQHKDLVTSFKAHGLKYTYSAKMYGLTPTPHGFLWRDQEAIVEEEEEEEQKADL